MIQPSSFKRTISTACCLPLVLSSSLLAAQPDFSGVWMAIGVVNPDGGSTAAVLSEEGKAKMEAFASQFTEIPEMGAACVGSGMPDVMFSLVSYPIEIVQNDSRLLMVAELETQVRRVYLDGRAPSPNTFPTTVGFSSAHFEGESLIIDTTLLEAWLVGRWPRSEDAQIREVLSMTTMDTVPVERTGFIAGVIPPLNDDVMVVDLTITDPGYYVGPQRRIAYYQHMPDDATSEYACSQGLWYDSLENYRVSN
jgi:hypothetical protein